MRDEPNLRELISSYLQPVGTGSVRVFFEQAHFAL